MALPKRLSRFSQTAWLPPRTATAPSSRREALARYAAPPRLTRPASPARASTAPPLRSRQPPIHLSRSSRDRPSRLSPVPLIPRLALLIPTTSALIFSVLSLTTGCWMLDTSDVLPETFGRTLTFRPRTCLPRLQLAPLEPWVAMFQPLASSYGKRTTLSTLAVQPLSRFLRTRLMAAWVAARLSLRLIAVTSPSPLSCLISTTRPLLPNR